MIQRPANKKSADGGIKITASAYPKVTMKGAGNVQRSRATSQHDVGSGDKFAWMNGLSQRGSRS